MESFTSIDFTSRDCKTNEHQSCKSLWNGLGIIVNCNCECHKKAAAVAHDMIIQDNRHGTERKALDLVKGPGANAKANESSFQEGTQNDYQ